MSGLTGHRMSGHRDAPVLKASQPLRYITRSIWIVPNRFQQEMKKLSCGSSSGWCFHRESSGQSLSGLVQTAENVIRGDHTVLETLTIWLYSHPSAVDSRQSRSDKRRVWWVFLKMISFLKMSGLLGLFKRDFEGRPDVMTQIWQHFRKVHGILHKTYDFYYVWTSNKKIMSNLRNGGGTSKFPPR